MSGKVRVEQSDGKWYRAGDRGLWFFRKCQHICYAGDILAKVWMVGEERVGIECCVCYNDGRGLTCLIHSDAGKRRIQQWIKTSRTT